MQAKTLQLPSASSIKPQCHSSKIHQVHSYNGTRVLPMAIWVRSPDVDRKDRSVYEIILYYEHNRACTIYRTLDDFRRLISGLRPWKGAPSFRNIHNTDGLQQFLHEALVKRGRDCAMEFFLRRRVDDCCAR